MVLLSSCFTSAASCQRCDRDNSGVTAAYRDDHRSNIQKATHDGVPIRPASRVVVAVSMPDVCVSTRERCLRFGQERDRRVLSQRHDPVGL
jgi:hypothetical protein